VTGSKCPYPNCPVISSKPVDDDWAQEVEVDATKHERGCIFGFSAEDLQGICAMEDCDVNAPIEEWETT
jgi:hypothetical protein